MGNVLYSENIKGILNDDESFSLESETVHQNMFKTSLKIHTISFY